MGYSLTGCSSRARSDIAKFELSGSLATVERRKAVGGWPAVLHCGGRRCAPTALRCSVPRGRAQNSPSHGRHPAAQAACARCSNRLRSTPRLAAMRNPRAPALLGAAEAHDRPPAHDFAKNHGGAHWQERSTAVHAEVRVGGRLSASAAPSSAGPWSARAQHALRDLTHRGCLSAVSAANAASSAMRPRVEQRRAVAAQRRPPQ